MLGSFRIYVIYMDGLQLPASSIETWTICGRYFEQNFVELCETQTASDVKVEKSNVFRKFIYWTLIDSI